MTFAMIFLYMWLVIAFSGVYQVDISTAGIKVLGHTGYQSEIDNLLGAVVEKSR